MKLKTFARRAAAAGAVLAALTLAALPALAAPKVQDFIAGKTIRKVVVVPGRLVNIVAV